MLILAPITVRLMEPVTATLDLFSALETRSSNVVDPLTLPLLIPLVSNETLLFAEPCAMRQSTEVSACQVDCSQAVTSILMACVYEAYPVLRPCTVILMLPVASLFALVSKLRNIRSREIPLLVDAEHNPTDIVIRLQVACAWPDFALTEVSETHDVYSAIEESILKTKEVLYIPKFEPYMVKRDEPVSPAFMLKVTLKDLLA